MQPLVAARAKGGIGAVVSRFAAHVAGIASLPIHPDQLHFPAGLAKDFGGSRPSGFFLDDTGHRAAFRVARVRDFRRPHTVADRELECRAEASCHSIGHVKYFFRLRTNSRVVASRVRFMFVLSLKAV